MIPLTEVMEHALPKHHNIRVSYFSRELKIYNIFYFLNFDLLLEKNVFHI